MSQNNSGTVNIRGYLFSFYFFPFLISGSITSIMIGKFEWGFDTVIYGAKARLFQIGFMLLGLYIFHTIFVKWPKELQKEHLTKIFFKELFHSAFFWIWLIATLLLILSKFSYDYLSLLYWVLMLINIFFQYKYIKKIKEISKA